MASVGIACLGLVPTIGGPDQPLHWAMTAGMVGFGALLLVRHRLRGPEPALVTIEAAPARKAGRRVLIITGVLTLLVLAIVAARVMSGGSIAPLSLLMPAAGLLWLASLGLKALRHAVTAAEAPAGDTDRPSRRPPEWKARAAGITSGHAASDRHASL
jgi:hypothetical protein